MPPRESDEEEDAEESGDEGVAAMASGGDEPDEVAMAGGGDGPDEADGAGDGDEPDDGLDDDDSSMELAYTTPTVIQKKLGMWKRIVGAICRAFEEVSTFPQSFEAEKVALVYYSHDGSFGYIAWDSVEEIKATRTQLDKFGRVGVCAPRSG